MANSSEEKPFDPTPGRLARAWEEGQIGFSTELQSALIFLLGTLALWWLSPWLIRECLRVLQRSIGLFHAVTAGDDQVVPSGLEASWDLLLLVGGIILLVSGLVAVAGGLQTRFNLTTKPLAVKFDRLDPIKGFQRIFSWKSAVRTLTSLARAAIVAVAAWLVLRVRLREVWQSGLTSFEDTLVLGAQLLLALALATAAMTLLVGLADLAWQKLDNLRGLRMTAEELREEQRQEMGDPMMRARIRKLGMDRLQKSIRKAVPRATVIVTNPTHFAVALRYDRHEAMAPVVLVKGRDHTARKIVELANQHGIPIVEDKPVARFLYYRVPVGKMIPIEMYLAVAKILEIISRRRAA